MPAPLAGMDDLRQVEFTEALAHLQSLIGTQVKATFNLYGRFLGGGIEGRLDRVETLPPDDVAISLVFDEGQGLFLDPAEVEVFIACGGDGSLEFRLADASVLLERSPIVSG
jgi:hypothetical protein